MMYAMPKIDIDADVLNQAIQGDRSALEILTRRWWPSIRRWAYIELGDKALAEDACQEAMIRLVRFIHRYDDQYTFQSWLRTIVRNCCKDARKSNSRHLHSALKEVAQPHRLERAVDIRHRASEACAAFHRLSPRQREIIALCYLGRAMALPR